MNSLTTLWSSLKAPSASSGWRTLGIYPDATCTLRIGVKHPEHLEGLLLDVPAQAVPLHADYPESHGFFVSPQRLDSGENATVRISLIRSENGNLDLFATLVEDIASRVAAERTAINAVAVFFARIKAWQAFMHVNEGSRLSEQEEIGLFGELIFLEQVLLKRMPIATAVGSWEGPFSKVYDFRHKDSAIEVKSTDIPSKTTVRISSLDQLDDTALISLYLIFVRLAPNTAGITLPMLVDRIRDHVQNHPASDSVAYLDEGLLRVGYIDAHRDRYIRRLNLVRFDAYRVSGDFPRLTKSGVPPEIRKVVYDIDLAALSNFNVDIEKMIDIFFRSVGGT